MLQFDLRRHKRAVRIQKAREYLATGEPFVCHYRRQDGTERRLFGRYLGSQSRTLYQLVVWDAENGGLRTINLDQVERILIPAYTIKPKHAKRVSSPEAVRPIVHHIKPPKEATSTTEHLTDWKTARQEAKELFG